MRTVTVTVDPDGRVAIPGTRPGQRVTNQVEPENAPPPEVAQWSPEEVARLTQQLLEGGRRVRERADPAWLALDHGEWLYGPDGLPR